MKNKPNKQELINRYHTYIHFMDSIQMKDWTKDTPYQDLYEKVMYQDFDHYVPEEKLLKKLKFMYLQVIEFERIPEDELLEIVTQIEETMGVRKDLRICTE